MKQIKRAKDGAQCEGPGFNPYYHKKRKRRRTDREGKEDGRETHKKKSKQEG